MNFSKIHIRVGIALGIAVGMVNSSGRPEAGYLSKIGPAPLRFQTERDSRPLNLPPLAMDDVDLPVVRTMPLETVDPTPAIRYAAAAFPPPASNCYSPSMSWISPLPTLRGPEPWPAPNTGSRTNTPSLSLPAGDLLTTTPQMLIDYFKPLHFGDNPRSESVLLPVNFIPATPAPPPASGGNYQTP
jgi:hypothetical protein